MNADMNAQVSQVGHPRKYVEEYVQFAYNYTFMSGT